MASPHPIGHSEPTSPFFEAIGRGVLRHRWLVLAGVLAFTGAMLWQIATNLRLDTSIEAFTASESDAQILLEEFRDDFGRDDFILVMTEGDVYSAAFLEKTKALHEELETLRMEVPTFGQRKNERLGKGESATATPVLAVVKAPVAADDGFDDFGDGDGFDDFDAESGEDAWAGEEAADGKVVVLDEVTSLWNARRVRPTADGIEVGDLSDEWPDGSPESLVVFEGLIKADKRLMGRTVSEGGRSAMMVLRPFFMSEQDLHIVGARVQAIADTYEDDGFKATATGLPAFAAELNGLMINDVQTMIVLAMITMALFLTLLFRNIPSVVGPGLVVAFAAFATFGFMAITGLTFTMLSTILPAFLITVGIGDSVHLISIYRDRRNLTGNNDEAIVFALGFTGVPVLFTTLTTMVGLGSFNLSSLDAVREMGMAGAYGVAMALVFSLVFLPVMLSFRRDLRPEECATESEGSGTRRKRDRLDRFLVWCNELSMPTAASLTAGRNRTLLGLMVLIGITLGGISLLRVYHNPLKWLPESSDVRRTFDQIDEELGGTANIQIVMDAPGELGVKSLAALKGLEAVEADLHTWRTEEFEGDVVGPSLSVLDVVAETHRALHGGAPEFDKIPEEQRAASDAMFMFENAEPADLRRLATADLKRTQMTVRLRWMEATAYGPLTAHLEAAMKKYATDGVVMRATGAVFTLVTVVRNMIGDLLISFAAAFLVITLMMVFILRSFKLGMIAMVPNLVPIMMIMAFMGFSGIPIDMNNLLIASVAIGLAVDDTIHFLHHFIADYEHHGKVERAIEHAFDRAGRAMVFTSIILSAGFFTYMGAELITIVRFGMLVGLTVIFALMVDLIFAPALLRLVYRDREPVPTTLAN